MKKIFVCSRLRGNIEENLVRARNFSREVLMLGHLPLTPHIYFTQFLYELNEDERNLGIESGLEFIKMCDEVWVYDKEVSEGMKKEIAFAEKIGKEIVIKW